MSQHQQAACAEARQRLFEMPMSMRNCRGCRGSAGLPCPDCGGAGHLWAKAAGFHTCPSCHGKMRGACATD